MIQLIKAMNCTSQLPKKARALLESTKKMHLREHLCQIHPSEPTSAKVCVIYKVLMHKPDVIGTRALCMNPDTSLCELILSGSWGYAGYHLATTIATPAAYAYLPFAFAALGWIPGMIALVAGIIVTWYSSVLLASLDSWNGVRYVRYRDLAYSICGAWGKYSVVAFQQIASLGNNITLGIVAGISMKALNLSFNPDSTITLQTWIIIFGAIQLVLSQFPTIHHLRQLNAACTFCTAAFAITATALSIYNGSNPPPDAAPVSYEVVGDSASITFGVFSALGTVAFAFGDTILPEIQATLSQPIRGNMYKGIHLCYSVISSTYIMTTVSGYWAYGNAVSPYLVNSFANPTWVIRMANFFALLQIIGCYQIYCRPTYEVLEIFAMDTEKGSLSLRNVIGRFVVTSVYCVLLTFIGCLFPFFGDFLALCGAIGFTPLDFVLPPLLWNMVYKPKWPRWTLHAVIIVVYSIVGVVGAIGAIRFIVIDSINYSVFANL